MEEQQKKHRKKKVTWWRRINRTLWWFFIFVLALVLVVWFAIRSQAIQQYVVNRVADWFSKDVGATVKADSIYFSLFDKLHIEGLYIEDQKGDTLLFCERLVGKLDMGISSVLQNNYKIKDLKLTNTKLYLSREVGQRDHNLQFLIDYFAADSTNVNKPKKDVFLAIQNIIFDKLWFQNRDAAMGETQAAYLPSAQLVVKKIDLPNNQFTVSSATFDGLHFNLLKYPYKPLPDEPEEEIADTTATKKTFVLDILKCNINDGYFSIDNRQNPPKKNFPKNCINFDQFVGENINIVADSLRYSDWSLQGNLRSLAFKEKRSGFELKKLTAKANITPRRAELTQLLLETPDSQLGDTLIFKYRGYRDFLDFEENVLMQARLVQGSKVAMKDILTFVPPLEANRFFTRNRKEVVKISGEFSGRVNNLKASDLRLSLSDGTLIEGDFRSRDLNVRGDEYLDLELKRLKTSIKTLRLLVPNFDPPKNFDKLHTLDFKGRFTGFFYDFVADGYLHTPLGNAQMDIKLDLKAGRDKARYTGSLDLIDFDLAAWMDNNQFGNITFRSKVAEGVGLTVATLRAKLEARVERIVFKGYDYRNLDIKGIFDKKLFTGDFNIADNNLNLAFNGTVDFNSQLPNFNFVVNAKKVNLKNLNITKQGYNLDGEVTLDFKGNNLSNLEGTALANNITLKHNNTTYQLDSLAVASKIDTLSNQRTLAVASEVANFSLKGRFDLAQIGDDLLQFVMRQHPEFAQRFNIISKKPPIVQAKNYAFDAKIKNTKNWLQVLDNKMDTLKNVSIKGNFDSAAEVLNLELEAPKIAYDNVKLTDVVLLAKANRKGSEFDLGVFQTQVGSNFNIPITAFYGEIKRDTVHFNMTSANFTSLLDNLNLNGRFFLAHDKLMQITFAPSNLAFYNEKWDIVTDNFIRFKEKYIETNNFRLSSGDKLVTLESTLNKGIALKMEKVGLATLNDFLKYEPLQFGGRINLRVETADVFKLGDLNGAAQMDTLLINDDNYGEMHLVATTKNLREPLAIDFLLKKDNQKLSMKGNFTPSYAAKSAAEKNTYQAQVSIEQYPLKMAEYFLKPNIKNTEGRFDVNVQVESGANGRPNVNGTARVYDAAITIDYLKTRYMIDNEMINISNSIFGVTNAKLKDKFGNVARINGGIVHNHLTKFGLNARIDSDTRFLFMETTKGDNKLFYGTAYGSGHVEFSGSFKQTNLYINATTGAGTLMHLPLGGSSSEVKEVSFITFRNPQDSITSSTTTQTTRPREARGLNIVMDLNARPDSEIQLIFNEQTGDIIKGRGKGEIQLKVTREGDFSMSGEYQIERGEYTFTLPIITDVFSVNKAFVVKKGGTIKWEGDPFDAEINLEASYSNIKTPVFPFIEESVTENLEAAAQQPTRVDLTMLLTGKLMKPDIAFRLNLPDLLPQLKEIVQKKLDFAQDNKDELNRQVALLILTGQFIPSSESSLVGGIGQMGIDVGINTLSEFVSNQLSQYISNLISEVIPDLDLNINYRQYEDNSDINNLGRVGREIELKLSKGFFGNRVNVDLSQDFDINNNNNSQQGQYYSPEFVLEYLITSDGRFKLRVFKLNEQELLGLRVKWGLGINYSIEFDSFLDLKGKNKTKKKRYDSPKQFFEGFRDAVKDDVKSKQQ